MFITKSFRVLRPIKNRFRDIKVYGFDIETSNYNKKFVCASIYYDEENKWTFFNKNKLLNFLVQKKFWGNYIVATNLGFDFFGSFDKDNLQYADLMLRGSDLITAKVYIHNKKFAPKHMIKKSKTAKYLTFIDTMNYARLSVEKLGRLIDVPKMKKPSCLGRDPINKKEWNELIFYNMNDSKISKLSLQFLYDSFIKLGGQPKPTIASQAMNIFKANYLDKEYVVHHSSILKEQFEGYYGGRTEAFCRGKLKKEHHYKLYDINSLYPFCMLKEMPDTNTLRITYKNVLTYINNFHGMSRVTISCPEMEYPLLPFRTKSKLLFPIGSFSGWYTHIELREAIKLGYIIKRVHKSFYYTKSCKPFTQFIEDLYNKRKSYGKDHPMNYVIKIVMNSLYGKFGQKFLKRDKFIHPNNLTFEDTQEYDKIEKLHGMYRCVKLEEDPSNFCMPIWAAYITSYARLELYKWIKQSQAIYCDTDSVITSKDLLVGEDLGQMKLETMVYRGVIVKPKFYMLNDLAKIKGVRCIRTCYDFIKVLSNPKVTDTVFCKFKEAIRRGMITNEIIKKTKILSLEDEKRKWEEKFNPDVLQTSKPIEICEEDYVNPDKEKKPVEVKIELFNR